MRFIKLWFISCYWFFLYAVGAVALGGNLKSNDLVLSIGFLIVGLILGIKQSRKFTGGSIATLYLLIALFFIITSCQDPKGTPSLAEIAEPVGVCAFWGFVIALVTMFTPLGKEKNDHVDYGYKDINDRSHSSQPIISHTTETPKQQPQAVPKTLPADADNKQNYIILGLPNSGKSVYFSVAMDYFQREFNNLESGYALTYGGLETDETVRGTMNALRHGEWPQHTQGAAYHDVKFSFKNTKGKFVTENLSFVDCGGETFEELFGSSVDYDCLSDEAEEVGVTIEKASGVIFVFSAETLKDTENNRLATSMFNLLYLIENFQNIKKLALVITKGDELSDKLFSVEEAKKYFAMQQPSAFARIRTLKCDVKFFVVSSVKAVISDAGDKIPPVNYSSSEHSMNIADPIVWLMDMKM